MLPDVCVHKLTAKQSMHVLPFAGEFATLEKVHAIGVVGFGHHENIGARTKDMRIGVMSVRTLQTWHGRKHAAVGIQFGARDASSFRHVGIVFEKSPILSAMFKTERIGPEMALGCVNPAKSFEGMDPRRGACGPRELQSANAEPCGAEMDSAWLSLERRDRASAPCPYFSAGDTVSVFPW